MNRWGLAPSFVMSASLRLCCKSSKSRGDNFSAKRRDKPRSQIDMASGLLPKSLVSSSLCDEVPHILNRKTHPQPREFLTSSGKGLLQQNHPESRHKTVCRRCPLLFSNRLIWVKHFQAIHHYSVDVAHGLVLLFGIGTKAVPSWDSKTRRNNLLGGLVVRRRRVQADMRTHLIHRPARDIFPPLGGIRVSSYWI